MPYEWVMLAPLAASLLRYGACALPITLDRCLFSKITTTMWSGRRPTVLGLFGVGRTFFGAGRRVADFDLFGAGRRTVAFDFLDAGGTTALGVSGEGGATATDFFGAAGTTVEEVLDWPGVAVDDGSAAVQAVDASSSVPAMVRLVHRGEPRTWNSPLDSKYSEFSIQRVHASKRKTWAGDGAQVRTHVIGDLYAIVEPQVGVSGVLCTSTLDSTHTRRKGLQHE
jgi:hypothetical protein